MRAVKLLLLMIAVPILAMLAAGYVLGDIEGEWKAIAVEEVGAQAAKDVPTLAWFCDNVPEAKADLSEACSYISIMGWMKRGAVGALGLGLALVAVIFVAGHLARNQRDLLWRLFTPGLRLTLFALVFLIIVHAALAMATIWYGESALTGRVHTYVMLLVAAGALTGISSMSKAAFNMVRRVTSRVLGQPITRQAHPEVWRFVESVAYKLGAQPPQHIIAGLFPNFFVTESDVEHPSGLLTGRTLYLSTSLCRILTRGELEAIIGHELGHFRGADTAFSQRFYPIYRGTEEALVALLQSSGGARSVALLPAIYTLDFFMHSFATAESEVSREREFLADRAGAEAAGTRNMATALAKISAFMDLWDKVPERMEEAVRSGQSVENASLLFAGLAQESAGPESLQGLDAQTFPHPIDSHPPLSLRLGALQTSLAEVGEAALRVSPEEPALSLFSQAEYLESELTADIVRLLRNTASA